MARTYLMRCARCGLDNFKFLKRGIGKYILQCTPCGKHHIIYGRLDKDMPKEKLRK